MTTRVPFANLQNRAKQEHSSAANSDAKAIKSSAVSRPVKSSATTPRVSSIAAAIAAAKPKPQAAAASSSISSLIQQDKARAKSAAAKSHLSLTATRLPTALLSSASLSAHLANKTLTDPKWSARQERGFVDWINCQISGQAQINSQSDPIIPDALFSRYRAAALKVFHSPAVTQALSKVDQEIDAAHLTLKMSSSELGEDVMNRREIVSMLVDNIASFWLKLSLECISGFEIPKPKSNEITINFLKEFLFESEDNVILPKPAAMSSESLGSVDADHRAKWELNRKQTRARETLKKVMRVFLLLDQAKLANIGGRTGSVSAGVNLGSNGPALFRLSSNYTSLAPLLSAFSNRFLNEGDCLRHLGFMGFQLSYSSPVEDMCDFHVKNLAVDLRDGVRLGKLAEVLVNGRAEANMQATGSASFKKGGLALHQPIDLISQMRIPADSEQKKLFNLNLALTTLHNHIPHSLSSSANSVSSSRSTAMMITAEDIYSGNQVKTYNFLWELIVKYDVQNLIQTGEIEKEITRIQRVHSKRSSSHRMYHKLAQQENLYFGPSEKLQVLLKWVQTVIWGQSIVAYEREHSTNHQAVNQILIENFTTSFRSGVAICLILNYYFPTLLRLDEISHPVHRQDKLAWDSNQLLLEEAPSNPNKENEVEEAKEGEPWVGSFSCKSVFAQQSLRDSPDFIASRKNFALLSSRLAQLNTGNETTNALLQSNFLFKTAESETPDEKSMITFLSYMCSRLLILAEEIHAVKVLQTATRNFVAKMRVKRALEEENKRVQAQEKAEKAKAEALARIALAAAEEEKRRVKEAEAAARRAEKAREQAQKEEEERVERERVEMAAREARLEKQRREWEEMQRLEREAEEAEMKRVAEEAAAAEAARIAEEVARSHAARLYELEYVSTVFSKHFRAKLARRDVDYLRAEKVFRTQTSAAGTIQRAFRCFQARIVLQQLQQGHRSYLAEQAARLHAVIVLQSIRRSQMAQKELRQLREVEQKRLAHISKCNDAAVSIQCAFRSHVARQALTYLKAEKAAAELAALRQYSAIKIQSTYRMFAAQMVLKELKHQEFLRVQAFEALCNASATKIQSIYRMHLAQGVLAGLKRVEAARVAQELLCNSSAVKIQSVYRMHIAQLLLADLKQQEAERVAHFNLCMMSATKIQTQFRMFQARRILAELKMAEEQRVAFVALCNASATTIQKEWKRFVARSAFVVMRKETISAVITFQKHLRARVARAVHAQLLAQKVARVQAEAEAYAQLQRECAIAIQCAFRCFAARKQLSNLQHEFHTRRAFAAEAIQRGWKCFVARQQLAFFRAEHAEKVHQQYLLQERSAVAIQCAFRQYVARRHLGVLRAEAAHAALCYSSAVIIQCAFRSFVARNQRHTLKLEHAERVAKRQALEFASASTIQRAYRCHTSRCVLANLRYEEAERVKEWNHQRFVAAITVQCAVRQFFARKAFRAAVVARQELITFNLCCNAAATTIQCALRSFQARKMLANLKAEQHAREVARAALEQHSALIIQCAFRSHLARMQRIRREAARQAAVEAERMRLAKRREEIEAMQRAVRELEARARALAQREREEKLALAREHAAIKLQSHMRARFARQYAAQLRQQKAEAERLAAEEAASLLAKKQAAILRIQSVYRGSMARMQFAIARAEAAVKAQAEMEAQAKMAQEIKAQRVREQKLAVIRESIASRRISHAWRRYTTSEGYLSRKLAKQIGAATMIQKHVRGMQARQEAKRRHAAIITIQKQYRGRALRKVLSVKIAARLAKIAANLRSVRLAGISEDKRVGHRTKTALEILLSSTNLSTLLHATQTLDRTTSLLPVCCRDALNQNAVPALLGVIRSLNRSKPHLLLLESTMNTLINLAAEPTTANEVFALVRLHHASSSSSSSASVSSMSHLDALIEAMQAYASSSSILMKLIRFLSLGVACDASLQQELATNASMKKRMLGMQSLLERKLYLENKGAASSAAKRAPASSSSSVDPKKRLKRTTIAVSSVKVAFDEFHCSCHGVINSAATVAIEKVNNLTAVRDHMDQLIQSIHNQQ